MATQVGAVPQDFAPVYGATTQGDEVRLLLVVQQ